MRLACLMKILGLLKRNNMDMNILELLKNIIVLMFTLFIFIFFAAFYFWFFGIPVGILLIILTVIITITKKPKKSLTKTQN